MAALVTDAKVVQRIWPDQTAHLFPEGEQRPLMVPAKLRPIIVLSRATEMARTTAALVIPCSQYFREDKQWGRRSAAVEANTWPHVHWLPASGVFRSIRACTLDFRWTYRLPVSQLERARRDAPRGFPGGPIAKLSEVALNDVLRRFREYLS